MDLFQDFRDLLEAFVASEVEFVLLGGYAVAFHGRPRATKDMDLLVGTSPENRERLATALDAFGAPSNVIESARRLSEGEVLFFGVSPLRVDILASASGIEFSDVHDRAVSTTIDALTLKVISLDDLIKNKLASGRPQDLEDAKALSKIRARAK